MKVSINVDSREVLKALQQIIEPMKVESVPLAPVADTKPAMSGPFVTCSIQEFRALIGRALNTQDPQISPTWAVQLHDKLFQQTDSLNLTFELTP